MNKTFMFLVLLCFINIAKSQEQKMIKTYADEIFNLEYKSAYAFASNFDNEILIKELQTLANTFYDAGQEEVYQPYTIKLQETKSVTYCFALLNKGFDELFHNQNKVDSFSFFHKAYTLSKELKIIPLQKISLYGILNFYHFQYTLTHVQHEVYLDDFGKLAQSNIEKCWYLWHRLYFKFEDAKPNRQGVHLLIKDFDAVVAKLSKTHKFLPEYYSLKGVYFEEEELLEKAEANYQKVIDNIKQHPHNKYLVFRTFIRLSAIAKKNKNHTLGFTYIEKAKAYIDVSDTLKSSVQICRYTSDLYGDMGDYKNAYTYLIKSLNSLSQTEYYDNNLKNAALKIELHTAEKERDNLLQAKELDRYSVIFTVLVIIFILGGIIVFLYYRNTQRKQRITTQQLEIEGQKFEKAQKEQELAAIDAMILGQEKERETIASDLHDNVCALLSAAKMQFEHLTERVEDEDQDKVNELFDKTKNLLDNAYDEVHAMAYQKNSGIMAKKALLPAIENLIKNNNGINGINIELQHFGLDERLEASKEIFIFRIIQELMANIIKHAKATEANISITLHKTSIAIIVEDNGIGISEDVLFKNKGLGIRNIKKRIQSIHGTMNLDSYADKGTSVVIEIPR